jgi:hypothetical protein
MLVRTMPNYRLKKRPSRTTSPRSVGGNYCSVTGRSNFLLQVCRQLDALSHFNYTPKPHVGEIRVNTINSPAILVEDALPMAQNVMNVSSSAPEQVNNLLLSKA